MTDAPKPNGEANREQALATYQEVAERADQLTTATLEALLRAGVQPPAILAGASAAIARFCINSMFIAPAVPSVRGVLQVCAGAMNTAAEQLLGDHRRDR